MATTKSIEEKAKRYDEALKYAKIYYTSGDEDMKMMMKTCFPALVEESEDERIRKEIKDFFSRIMLGQENFLKEDYDWNAWIAWLEKQGEQETVSKVKIGEKYRCCNSVRYTCFQTGKVYEVKDSFDAAMISLCSDCFVLVDDSVEWKPADKVKIGDWVVVDGVTQQVTQIRPDGFDTDRAWNGKLTFKDVHLWTIKDARGGDVLVASDKSLFIYDGSINENGSVGFHIAFTEDMNIILNSDDGCGWEEKDSCHPATKEQRDLLFLKMKEAGYEWDAEKKELKKIGQKPKKCMYSNDNYTDEERKVLCDGCEEECELRQKPAWSEEGKKKISELKTFIAQCNGFNKVNRQKAFNLIDALNPQPKQEWSEEDKNMLQSILDEYKSMPTEKRNWLKSLKYRYTWKPDELQLECLSDAVSNYNKRGYEAPILKELLEQLKKLKL